MKKDSTFTIEEMDRIIEMAWEDRTPFGAIEAQFGVSEKEVIKIMRRELKRKSFDLWRKRVHSKISQKHRAKRRNLPLSLRMKDACFMSR